jgi:hypothetical protein
VSRWGGIAPTIMVAVTMADPFAFFRPTLQLQPSDRTAIAQGNAFARTLPAPPGNVIIAAAVPVRIDGARLVAWTRDIAALRKSPVVRQIGRFAPVPSVADVRGLTLDPADIDEIARCNPAKCGVKLEASEIAHIRAAIGGGNLRRSEEAVQEAFREVVVGRVGAYLQSGRNTLAPPAFLEANWPVVSRELREFPRETVAGSESFLYWSKDAYAGKPIISITHVTIVRGRGERDPDVLVVGRQVFATHYTDGAWSFTALLRDERTNYLAYLNQSDIDLLDSWYGGLVRRVIERRLRDEAVDVMNGLRRRLESGDPPVDSGD